MKLLRIFLVCITASVTGFTASLAGSGNPWSISNTPNSRWPGPDNGPQKQGTWSPGNANTNRTFYGNGGGYQNVPSSQYERPKPNNGGRGYPRRQAVTPAAPMINGDRYATAPPPEANSFSPNRNERFKKPHRLGPRYTSPDGNRRIARSRRQLRSYGEFPPLNGDPTVPQQNDPRQAGRGYPYPGGYGLQNRPSPYAGQYAYGRQRAATGYYLPAPGAVPYSGLSPYSLPFGPGGGFPGPSGFPGFGFGGLPGIF